ncbi:MAG: NACHT domain-containing protein [Candidatus Ozemobacteraceae bacterium]
MSEQSSTELVKRKRLVRVFVSSTFSDLQAEREWLVHGIFPQIRNLCERLGVTWSFVDIRSGLSCETAEEALLDSALFSGNTDAHTFFLGLLGERYGCVPLRISSELLARETWLARFPSASITEIEILVGVLNHPRPARFARFYFRSPEFLEQFPLEKRGAFLEEPVKDRLGEASGPAKELAASRKNRLADLKDRIRQSGKTIREGFTGPRELGDLVLADLTNDIETLFPETEPPSAIDLETAEQEAVADRHSHTYLSRQSLFDLLTTHADQDGPPLLITGPEGSGKSALMASWAQRRRFSHPDRPVFLHHVGETDAADGALPVVRRLMSELARNCGLEFEVPETLEGLRNAFPALMHQTAARSRAVILIDGLERLAANDTKPYPFAAWLPAQIPQGIRLVLTSRECPALKELSSRGWPITTIEPLKLAERRGIARKLLRERRLLLSPARIEKVATSSRIADPLMLRTILDLLPETSDQDAADRFLTATLAEPNLSGLYTAFLHHVDDQLKGFRTGLLGDALALIRVSRQGLSELELRELLGMNGQPLPPNEWFPLMKALKPLVTMPAGRLRFAHDSFGRHVEEQFIHSKSERNALHEQLADYFRVREPSPRSFAELTYHLLSMRAWGRLYGYLSNAQTLAVACRTDMGETLSLWRAVEAGSSLRMSDAYAPFLNGSNRPMPAAMLVARLLSGAGHNREAASLKTYLASVFRRMGDTSHLLDLLDGLADNHLAVGEKEAARAVLEEAVKLSREAKEEERLARLFLRLSQVLLEMGELERAAGLLTESEELFRRGADPFHLQSGLGRLSQIRYLKGDLDGALKGFREQERLCRELGRRDRLSEALHGQSGILRARGDLDGALKLLQEMESLCRDSDFPEGLQLALNGMAVISRARGDLDGAVSRLNEAETICRKLGHRTGLQVALGGKGSICRARGDLNRAMDIFREQEAICRELGLKEGLQIALAGQASILRDRGRLEEAMQLFKEAEKLCRDLGFHEGLQRILCSEAMILRDRGDLEGALGYLRDSENICRRLGLKSGLQRSLENLALVLKSRGDLDGAMALLKEQEKICRDLGILLGLQVSLGNQAQILHFRGYYDQAMELFQEQEHICRRLGLKDRLQSALVGQAVIRRARGEIQASVALLKEQEAICLELGLKAGLQVSYYHQAIILLMHGDLDGAMELFKKQEQICLDAGYREGLQASLGSQAVILRNRGDLAGSAALFQKQEQICREAGYKEGLQVALCGQAAILQARGDLDGAMTLLNEGERISRELSHREGLQRILCSQSLILQARGNYEGAMTVLKEAEKICRSLDYKSGLQRVLENQAAIFRHQGRIDEAFDLLRQQEAICREVGIKAGLAACLGDQAILLKNRGDLDGAMILLKEQEQISRELGLKAGLAKAMTNQAQILAFKMDRMREAMALVGEAYKLATDHGLLALANQIKGTLDQLRDKAETGGDPTLKNLGNLHDLQARLSTQAALLKNRGDFDRALAQLKTQERICRELNDLDELGSALDNQAQILRERGQFEDALTLMREAEQSFRKAGNSAGLAQILVNIALLLVLDLHRPTEAMPVASEVCILIERENIAEVPRETLKLLLDFIHSSQPNPVK